MIAVESVILATAWEENCQLMYTEDGDKRFCAQPTSILNFLFVNDAKHEELCKDGFCNMPEDNLDACGLWIDWGTFPCTSPVYDWRDGKLADESDWPKLVHDTLCDPSDELRNYYIDKEGNCTEKRLESTFTRSNYLLGWPLQGFANRDDRPAEQAAARSASAGGTYGAALRDGLVPVVDGISATTTSARVVASEPDGDGRTFNVIWFAFSTGQVDDILFGDAILASISLAFVGLYLGYMTGSR